MKQKVRKIGIRTKIVIPVAIVNIIVCVVMGVWFNSRMQESVTQMAVEQSMVVARLAATGLDGDMLQKLTPGSEQSEDYQTIVDHLTKIKNNTSIKYVYTVFTDGKDVFFGVDASKEKKIGDAYLSSYDAMKSVFDGNEMEDDHIYDTPDGLLISSCVPIKNSAGEVVAALSCDYDATEISREIQTNRIMVLMITIVCIVVSVFLSNLIIQRILRGLKKVDNKIYEIVHNEGDLTQSVVIHSGDELELIANNINSLIAYIRTIMQNIQESSRRLSKTSEKIVLDVTQTHDHVTDVSATMEQMSAAMEESTATLNQIDESITDNFDAIMNINETAIQGDQFSSEITKRASKLKEEALQKKENAEKESQLRMTLVNEKIKKSQSVARITELTSTIIGITKQTNLLALNASIEAARAGEAGKGFAVVADEIGKLAGNSAEVANQINQISETVIEAVEELTQETRNLLNLMDEVVKDGFGNLVSASEQYNDDAESMNECMRIFAQDSEKLKDNMVIVKKGIDAVNVAVEESAKGIEGVANMSVNITENVDEIKKESDTNNSISGDLTQEIQKFKL